MTPASEVKVIVRLLRILSFAAKLQVVVGTSFAEKQAHASFIQAAQIVGALLMYLVAVGLGRYSLILRMIPDVCAATDDIATWADEDGNGVC